MYYTPDCLVTEEFDIKGFEWLRWIKRQNINTKINFPHAFYLDLFIITIPGLISKNAGIENIIIKMILINILLVLHSLLIILFYSI